MRGILIKCIPGRQLNDLTEIHHCHAVGDMTYYAKVVGDEQVGKSYLLLNVLQQIDDLCLHGDI
jgi:hypothetical protein